MHVWKRVLATAVLLLFAVVGLSATAGESGQRVEQAKEWLPTIDQAGTPGPADEQGRYRYLVRFDASGALNRYRSLRGTVETFSINEPMSRALLAEVGAELDQALGGIAALLGREIEATHRYLVTHSGAALWLHPAEARALLERPDVVSVERERIFELHTYRGPEFIGADAIWSGAAVPGGTELSGGDQVIAILDSGLVDPDEHDAFANDPTCGHGDGGTPDKVLSIRDCASTDGTGECNGPHPLDNNSHGSHVAGTAAGNRLQEGSASPDLTVPGDFDAITGVAPCAHIRSYKICPGGSCPGADIAAGLNNVILDGDVTVANFSVSGGGSPWGDGDLIKLDLVEAGVLVAASAGNAGMAGSVGHRGPWVLTVAASTRDVNSAGDPVPGDVLASFSSRGPTPAPFENIQKPDITAPGVGIYAANLRFFVSASGPGTPPASTQDIPLIPGSRTRVQTPRFSGRTITFDPVQDPDSDGCDGFPDGFFDDAVALVRRGGCQEVDKINHAFDAGADFILIYNNQSDAFGMDTTGQSFGIDAFSISGDAGEALKDFIDSSGGAAELDYLIPAEYGFKSGTSMSSPHAAGAAALVRQARPDWSVMEVHSALRMSAVRDGFKPGGETPWDWDDVGSGRVDLTVAALAGLVMDETTQNFIDADPNEDGDVRTLNLPAIRDMDCELECSFTRTVRNTLETASSWSVSGQGFDGAFSVSVDPASFSFGGNTDETQTLTITVTPQDDLTEEVAFGEILLTEADAKSPELHWTVAIRGTNEIPPVLTFTPESFDFALQTGQSAQQTLTIGNDTDIDEGADLTFSLEQAPAAQEIMLGGTLSGTGPQETIELRIDEGINWLYSPAPSESVVWFNQFTPTLLEVPFVLESASIPFLPSNGGVEVGDRFDVYVWSAPDGDPASEMILLASETGLTVQGAAFHSISFSDLIEVTADTGDVLIGVAFREKDRLPIAADDGPSVGRSWVAHGFPDDEPADPPDFDNATTFGLTTFNGNFVVRGLGTGGTPCLQPSDVDWLSTSPISGAVAPQQTVDVTVTVDMDGLSAGSYEALLCLNSNDPDQSLAVIPVAVEVTAPSEPTIDVDPGSLSATLLTDQVDSASLTITNFGQDTLDWDVDEDPSGCDLPGWAAAEPLSGLLDQDASEDLTVTFDSDGLAPDTYEATLCIASNDPDNAQVEVNLELTVTDPPATVTGAITSLGYCSDDPEAGAGANIEVQGQTQSFATTADAAGQYQVDVPAEEGPVDVTVILVGHLAATETGIALVSDETVTLGFDLELDAPCATLEPGDISFLLAPGGEENDSITIGNQAGAAQLSWSLGDDAGCFDPAVDPWLSPASDAGVVPAGDEQSVLVTASAEGLDEGLYQTVLCIVTNDSEQPQLDVPVALEVLPTTIFEDRFEAVDE